MSGKRKYQSAITVACISAIVTIVGIFATMHTTGSSTDSETLKVAFSRIALLEQKVEALIEKVTQRDILLSRCFIMDHTLEGSS